MSFEKVTTVCGVAVVTMALTLSLVGPGRVVAVDQDAEVVAEIKPVIQQPTAELAGLQIKLKMDKAEYAPGDEPVVMLEVTNPAAQRVDTHVWIDMTASSVASLMSRVPTMPQSIWTEKCQLSLEPGATQTIRLNTGQKLVTGTTVFLTLRDADQQAAMAKRLNVLNAVELPQAISPSRQ